MRDSKASQYPKRVGHTGFNNASRSSLAAGESGTFLRETNSYGSLREVMGSGSVVVKP